MENGGFETYFTTNLKLALIQNGEKRQYKFEVRLAQILKVTRCWPYSKMTELNVTFNFKMELFQTFKIIADAKPSGKTR